MSIYRALSEILLALAFFFIFLGAFYNFAYGSYFASAFLICSLALKKKLTPNIFFCIAPIGLILFVFSPSPVPLVTLFPFLGFLFSGNDRRKNSINSKSRYLLWAVIFIYYTNFFVYNSIDPAASHNHLSALLALALLAEFFYFGSIPILYLPLILVSFIYFGNRSSIFLLLAYLKIKKTLLLILCIGALVTLIPFDVLQQINPFASIFDKGGFFYRSYKETRLDYFNEFIHNYDVFSLNYKNWSFASVPETADGYYDLHNSFLTIIVRDSYLGIFKVFLWFSQIFNLPFGLFSAVTLRAGFDTFLLGGVSDILLYAIFGNSIRNYVMACSKYFNNRR